MSEPIYAVTLHVRGTLNLSTVIAVVEKVATVVSVVPTEETETVTPPSTERRPHYVNGKRFKGISGPDLVIKTLKESRDGTCTNEQLSTIFVANGFAPASYSSPISGLLKDGRIRRLGVGKWGLVGGTTIHKGAGQ